MPNEQEPSGDYASAMADSLRARFIIEQAKGVLMARDRISEDEAFELLVKRSQAANRKLRDLAREVVEETQAG